MRILKKASGALKDRYKIWVAKLSPYGSCRNPDLETAIIKATSHDEQCMDYKNVQRVFQWLRISQVYLKPLLYTLSLRMEKTRSWVVALKGLMLIHGLFCFELPTVQIMGRLPFDLSHFSDRHISPENAWVFNAFIRSYFAYLDQRSTMARLQAKREAKNAKETELTLIEELRHLEKLQGLIDMLLQIRPRNNNKMNVVLILEAMDCVVEEILEVYGKFSKGIERVLLRIFDIGGKEEANVFLNVLMKAELQGQKLSQYFDFVREIGVLNTSECPQIVRIPEKDNEELQRMMTKSLELEVDQNNGVVGYEDKAIVLFRDCNDNASISDEHKGLTTVITNQWEVFDDDEDMIVDVKQNASSNVTSVTATNPFGECYSLVPYCNPIYNHDFPDLITL